MPKAKPFHERVTDFVLNEPIDEVESLIRQMQTVLTVRRRYERSGSVPVAPAPQRKKPGPPKGYRRQAAAESTAQNDPAEPRDE